MVCFSSARSRPSSRPAKLVDGTSLGQGGELTDAVAKYYNPLAAPSVDLRHVPVRRQRVSDQQRQLEPAEQQQQDQYTNWDQALDRPGGRLRRAGRLHHRRRPDGLRLRQPGDPFTAPPDVAASAPTAARPRSEHAGPRGAERQPSRDTARACSPWASGRRCSNPESVDRLTRSPAQVCATPIADFDIETTDVALVTDFDDLAAVPSAARARAVLAVADDPQAGPDRGRRDYQPAAGWDRDGDPDRPGRTFGWILPTGAGGPSKTLTTDANGFAQFQWEPIPPRRTRGHGQRGPANPATSRAGPDGRRLPCELKDDDGDMRSWRAS